MRGEPWASLSGVMISTPGILVLRRISVGEEDGGVGGGFRFLFGDAYCVVSFLVEATGWGLSGAIFSNRCAAALFEHWKGDDLS